MIVSSVSETQKGLIELLDKVRHGEEVTIVDHDRPVARIVPIVPAPVSPHMARLIARGIAIPPKNPDRTLPPLIVDDGDYSLVETLLAMREEERG